MYIISIVLVNNGSVYYKFINLLVSKCTSFYQTPQHSFAD